MASERVQKILAQAGIASRRKAEELITDGEVTINGKLAKLGDKAEWGKDAIKVKGKLLRHAEEPVYIALYKPKGMISMLIDTEDRPTLSDLLEKVKTRVFPIGRLDFNSEGLILLTNDGALAEKIQKGDQILRTYSVKVKGHPDPEMLTRLEKGAWVGHVRKRLLKPHSVRMTQGLPSKSVIEVCVLGSGAFDMKGLFELKGFLVEKIVRTAIGHITLKGLPVGGFRYLKDSQVQALLTQPELAMRQLQQDIESARPIAIEKARSRAFELKKARTQAPRITPNAHGSETRKPQARTFEARKPLPRSNEVRKPSARPSDHKKAPIRSGERRPQPRAAGPKRPFGRGPKRS